MPPRNPARFNASFAEKTLIAPPRKVWQVTRDAYGQTVGCWVTVPGRYAVHHRRVMVDRRKSFRKPRRAFTEPSIVRSWCSRRDPAGSRSAEAMARVMALAPAL